MRIKYVPYEKTPIRGQAILNNFTRTLKYSNNNAVNIRLNRGMPLYEMQKLESVRNTNEVVESKTCHTERKLVSKNIESKKANHAHNNTNSSSCSVALEALTRLEGRSYLSDNDYPPNSVNRSNCIDKGEFLQNLESRNMLIKGEALSACAYLKEKGIKVDLVYIDPPFASGADYAKKVYLRQNANKTQSSVESRNATRI